MKFTIKNKLAEKILLVLIIIITVMMIMPLAAESRYCRPTADDFGAAIETHAAAGSGAAVTEIIKAAFRHAVLQYHIWQGTYVSEFLFSLHPGIFGEKYYAVSPVIIMSIVYFCILCSVFILNKTLMRVSSLYVFALAGMLFSFFMNWMPFPAEGLFWYSGGINYIPWTFFNLLEAVILYHVYCRGG